MNSLKQTGRRREASYPLISIVQLVTFCISLVVCLDGPKLSEHFSKVKYNPESVLPPILLSLLFGFLVGATIGLGQIRNWQGMFLCSATGTLVSALIILIYVAPAKPAQAVAAALLPLLTTVAVRIRTP